MIKSEEQRQQEMRAVQNEWWGKLTDVEKSKATGMVLDQATGWWAVSDVDSRERLMRTYIALKEKAAPVEDNPNSGTDKGNSTETTTEGNSTEDAANGDSTEGTDEGTAEENLTENSETTEENVEEETKTEEAAEQNDAEASDETGKANPTDVNAAPEKTKAAPAKKGGKKTSKK